MISQRAIELRPGHAGAYNNLGSALMSLGHAPPASTGFWAPITTFAPEPYDLLCQIVVVIHPNESGYTAGFFDANIHASGDTDEEALRNLKSLILDTFEALSMEPPRPARPRAQEATGGAERVRETNAACSLRLTPEKSSRRSELRFGKRCHSCCSRLVLFDRVFSSRSSQ